MPAVYKGFRTRDFAPRVLPGKTLPKPSQAKLAPSAPNNPERRASTSRLLPK